MSASDEQIQELANAVALQADALGRGKIPFDQMYAHVRLMAHNVDTLKAWTKNLTPRPISQHRISHVLPPLNEDFEYVSDNPTQQRLEDEMSAQHEKGWVVKEVQP